MPGMQPSPALPEPALPQHIFVGSSPPHTYPQSLPGQLGAPASKGAVGDLKIQKVGHLPSEKFMANEKYNMATKGDHMGEW